MSPTLEPNATLQSPIEVRLPHYPCTFNVTRFERRRNAGPVLTMAVATWILPGRTQPHNCTNVVTLMRLADVLSNCHDMPINRDAYYGPTGRRAPVGRTTVGA